jgi:hypothetical protein
MGTRNILVAFWMWLAVVFLLGYVLNENSSMCIFGTGLPGSKCGSGSAAGEGFQGPALTPEESQVYSILKAKVEKGAQPSEKPGSILPSAPTQGSVQAPVQAQVQTQEPVQADTKVDSDAVKEESFVDTYLTRMNTLKEGYQNPRF